MSAVNSSLVMYLFRREPNPFSKRWHLNAYRFQDTNNIRVPGLVEETMGEDQLKLIFAVPSSPLGQVNEETQHEYEDIADERFSVLYPMDELA